MFRFSRNLFFKSVPTRANQSNIVQADKTIRRYIRNHPISHLAFIHQNIDMKAESNLRSTIRSLRNKIEKTENELSDINKALSDSLADYEKLKSPFYYSEQIYRDIENMAELIIKGIHIARLQACNTFVDGPSRGYNIDTLDFFKPILAAYGMDVNIKTSQDQRGKIEYLYINFPAKLHKVSLFQENNTRYNEWLISFDHRLASAYQTESKHPASDFPRPSPSPRLG